MKFGMKIILCNNYAKKYTCNIIYQPTVKNIATTRRVKIISKKLAIEENLCKSRHEFNNNPRNLGCKLLRV